MLTSVTPPQPSSFTTLFFHLHLVLSLARNRTYLSNEGDTQLQSLKERQKLGNYSICSKQMVFIFISLRRRSQAHSLTFFLRLSVSVLLSLSSCLSLIHPHTGLPISFDLAAPPSPCPTLFGPVFPFSVSWFICDRVQCLPGRQQKRRQLVQWVCAAMAANFFCFSQQSHSSVQVDQRVGPSCWLSLCAPVKLLRIPLLLRS